MRTPQSQSQSQNQSRIATDGQSVSQSWCRAPYSLTVTVLLLWGALSDESSHCLQ
jgi:hypothetical protein